MKTTILEKDGKTIVSVKGELDTSTCNKFKEDVAPLAEKEGIAVELDLSELDYISSRGLRVLISLQQDITAKNGTMRIRNVSPSVREVLDVTGLSKSFLKID